MNLLHGPSALCHGLARLRKLDLIIPGNNFLRKLPTIRNLLDFRPATNKPLAGRKDTTHGKLRLKELQMDAIPSLRKQIINALKHKLDKVGLVYL